MPRRPPLLYEDPGVEALNRVGPEAPLVINVHDHQADFVNLTGEHDRLVTAGSDRTRGGR